MIVDLSVGSHVPVLAAAVNRTKGAVLELGCGWWSTPMLRLMCHYMRVADPQWRRLESYDTDDQWGATFNVPVVKDWKQWKPQEKEYGVAFVDCSPGESRVELIQRLRGICHFIVAHDTEADIPPSGGNYRWTLLDGVFKHQTIYKDIRPWTTVYSDREEFIL